MKQAATQADWADGTVTLGAAHSGDSVLITIRDDGAGLDREAIHAKAMAQGLIAAQAELSDQEIFAQIFAPGPFLSECQRGLRRHGVGGWLRGLDPGRRGLGPYR